jgi:ankyrin repeat protein
MDVSFFVCGDYKKVKSFIRNQNDDLSEIEVVFKPDWCLKHYHNENVTLLHLAVYHGWLDVTKELIRKHNCSANAQLVSNFGRSPSPLHYAAAHGHFQILEYLIKSQKCNPNIKDGFGKIPLHLASRVGHLSVVKSLVDDYNSNPFLKSHGGSTSLHYACEHGHIQIVKFFLSKNMNEINVLNDDDETPLHFACRGGQYHTVRFLMSQKGCDVFRTDKIGNNILHKACCSGNLEILKHIISSTSHDFNCQNIDKRTPLHSACYCGQVNVVNYILSTGNVDPLQRDKNGNSPIEVIPSYCENKYDILKLFHPFSQCRIDYPIETYCKVYFCGNPATGKSSLAEVISYRSNKPKNYQFDPFNIISDVKPYTTGIIPRQLKSHDVGNVIVYDFAGHPEYYSSHAGVMENTMLKSPGVFVIFINAVETNNEIKKQLCYWANFVKCASHKAKNESEIIIVASHADQMLHESKNFENKKEFINTLARRLLNSQQCKYKNCVGVDCHRPGGLGITQCMEQLSICCKEVLARSDRISFYCHVLYAFLQKKVKTCAICLTSLLHLIKDQNDPSLPYREDLLINLLKTLHDKGLILFLQGSDRSSWVIIDITSLLHIVNGKIFSPKTFDEHHSLCSNTGIVPLSVLHDLFPDYDFNMLVSFLSILEFCHLIDANTFNDITTNMLPGDSLQKEPLLFFPALINVDIPETVRNSQNDFGWCLWCPHAHQFFSTRFLHVLLLRIAYKYALKCSSHAAGTVHCSSIYKWQRSCIVWKNGIQFERDFSKVTVIVSELNRSVILLLKSLEGNNSQIHSCLIRCYLINELLQMCKEFCPFCNVQECIIYPAGNIKIYQELSDQKSLLFAIERVARATVLKMKTVKNIEESIEADTDSVLRYFEPYKCISTKILQDLFIKRLSRDIVPENTLLTVKENCYQLQFENNFTYGSLCTYLNKYSIFSNRSPLVS